MAPEHTIQPEPRGRGRPGAPRLRRPPHRPRLLHQVLRRARGVGVGFALAGLAACGSSGWVMGPVIGPAPGMSITPSASSEYTAIAWTSGDWYASGASTAAEAEGTALARCRTRNPGKTCTLAGGRAFASCGAIAEDDDGALHLMTGDSRQVAVNEALARCRADGGTGCRLAREQGGEAVYGQC